MPRLTFIDKVHEEGDVYTFKFVKPQNLRHRAGQHGLFVIPGWYRPHPFTLSSAPEENFVSFSTHVKTGSRFKRRIMKFKQGDTLFLFGPVMNFTLDRSRKSHIFLAQGIGVTPFRSMLVHAHHAGVDDHITLVHVDNETPVFKDVTSSYATESYYPTSAEAFRDIVAKLDKDALFYLSGSPKFVRTTRQFLHTNGVKRRNIKIDLFLGY